MMGRDKKRDRAALISIVDRGGKCPDGLQCRKCPMKGSVVCNESWKYDETNYDGIASRVNRRLDEAASMLAEIESESMLGLSEP